MTKIELNEADKLREDLAGRIKRAAQLVIDVQDASNLSGIVGSWRIILSDTLWPEANRLGLGTNWVNRHPINVMFASKVTSLIGDDFSKAYDECKKLAGE